MSDEFDRPPPSGEGLTFEKIWAIMQENERKAQKSREEWDQMFKESERKAQESREEYDRKARESREEWDRKIEESREKWDREARESRAEWDRKTQESREEFERMKKETWDIFREAGRHLDRTDLLFEKNEKRLKEIGEQMGGMNNTFGKVAEYMVAPKLLEKFGEDGLDFQTTSHRKQFHDNNKKVIFEVDIMLENGEIAMLVEVKAKAEIGDVNRHVKQLENMRAYADLHGDGRKLLGAFAGVVMPKKVRDYAFESGFYVIVPSGESFDILHPVGGYKLREW